MNYMESIKTYISAYYILNTIACAAYVVMKAVHPICQWFFREGERCELSWADTQTFMFVAIVLAIKNTKWKRDANKDLVGMAFAFFKAVNLVLFLRTELLYFIVYFVICLIFFVVLPEPMYTGPDDVQLFNGVSLENELRENPNVTWLIEFYTVWSPPCKKLSEPFAEVSLNYKSNHLKFGKIDLGRNPLIAKSFKIDDSVTSRQLPTLIIFKNGKEVMRRPVRPLVTAGKVVPFHFTKENIINAFELKSCFDLAKSKDDHEAKKTKLEEKKRT